MVNTFNNETKQAIVSAWWGSTVDGFPLLAVDPKVVSLRGRVVYSLITHRQRSGARLSRNAIGTETGINRNSTLPGVLTELESLGLLNGLEALPPDDEMAKSFFARKTKRMNERHFADALVYVWFACPSRGSPLSLNAAVVFWTMLHLSQDGLIVPLNRANIHRLTGISESGVRRSLDCLTGHDLIRVEKRNGKSVVLFLRPDDARRGFFASKNPNLFATAIAKQRETYADCLRPYTDAKREQAILAGIGRDKFTDAERDVLNAMYDDGFNVDVIVRLLDAHTSLGHALFCRLYQRSRSQHLATHRDTDHAKLLEYLVAQKFRARYNKCRINGG